MFYNRLSSIYDEIFPFNDETYTFLKSYAKEGLPVLDMGCSTGSYVREFRKDGFSAFGFEKELSYRLPDYCFYADMLRLPIKKEARFGLIYSIGNTVVHVRSKLEFYNLVKSAVALLESKSFFIVQLINYDRIYGYELKNLPDIETENLLVKRHYDYEDDTSLIFKMQVYDKNEKELNTIETVLTPIFMEDIKNAAARAGAGFVQFFGDFKGNKFFIKENLMLIAAFYKV